MAALPYLGLKAEIISLIIKVMPVPDNRYQISDIKKKMSDFRLPTSDFRPGFAFIEIFLGLLIFGVIVVMLATASGSVFTRRHVDQQAIASKVASREIENVRNLAFASITNINSQNCSITDQKEANDLPGCLVSRTITWPYGGNNDLKFVSVTVQWKNEKGQLGPINPQTGQASPITMDTLIYKDAGTENAGL